MLRIYRGPDGHKYQYPEGEAPEGYVLADEPEPEPGQKSKARTTRNKARAAKTKTAKE